MRVAVKLVGFGFILASALGGGLAAGAALGPFEDGGRGGSHEKPEADHAAESGHPPVGTPRADADEGDEHAD